MDRICSRCGAHFNGTSRDIKCEKCRKIQVRKLRTLTCQMCGGEYKTYATRSYFCPDCAAQRRKKPQGKAARPLGSVDKCEQCGAEYIVVGGLQRFCPSCAADRYRARARAEYYNGGKEKRQERIDNRKKASAVCAVCEKEFEVSDARVKCCSPECSEAYAEALRKKWRQENREHLLEYDKQWWIEHGAERNQKRRKK